MIFTLSEARVGGRSYSYYHHCAGRRNQLLALQYLLSLMAEVEQHHPLPDLDEHDEPHVESMEGNHPETLSEEDESHEAGNADASHAPQEQPPANGTPENHLPDNHAMDPEVVGEPVAVPEVHHKAPAEPRKQLVPTSPSKSKARTSITVKPTGKATASAPATPVVKKVSITSHRHASNTRIQYPFHFLGSQLWDIW